MVNLSYEGQHDENLGLSVPHGLCRNNSICYGVATAAIDDLWTNRYGCVPIKLYLQNQEMGHSQSLGHNPVTDVHTLYYFWTACCYLRSTCSDTFVSLNPGRYGPELCIPILCLRQLRCTNNWSMPRVRKLQSGDSDTSINWHYVKE